MSLKKYCRDLALVLIVFIMIICVVACSKGDDLRKDDSHYVTVKQNDMFDYEKNKPDLTKTKDISAEEYEAIIQRATSLSKIDEMKDVIIKVNGKTISKLDFEMEKIIKEQQYTISQKYILYSIIKPLVLKSEAEKLGIKPSQDSIDLYMNNIKSALDIGGPGTEFINAYIKGKNITTEDYLAESEETAYDMFQREALYEYAETLDEYDTVEDYITDLINGAEIVFYDSEIEKICRGQ